MGKHLFELADFKAYNAEIRERRRHLDAKWGIGIDSSDDDAKYTSAPEYIAELSNIVKETYSLYAAEDARLIEERRALEAEAAGKCGEEGR